MIAYVVAMAHAGENASMLHALGGQGLLGATSAMLLMSGVST
jgi:hypothetical protein